MKKSITWTIEERNVKDLIPADYNPRRMSEQERKDLEASIDEFGTAVPLVVNIGKRKDILVGGHQRATIYLEKGITKTKVAVPSRELTLAEEKKLNLRLNKNVGGWDFEKLGAMDLETLVEVGFGEEELSTLWDDVDMIEDEFNVTRAIKEIKTPKSRPGDVYKLGEHRLMCGDSTDKEQVKILMGKDLADVVYCDPPYNIGVNYTKGTNNGPRQKATYKNDKLSVDSYKAFIDTTIRNALNHTKPNAHVFYWCDERFIWLLQQLFASNKVENKRVCLWIKNNISLTPQVAFNKAYEPCVYGTRGKPYLNKSYTNLNEVMNKEVSVGNQGHEDIMELLTVWLNVRDSSLVYLHPTQKPVTLAERPLKRCSAPGYVVLDLFGGSGSTLIACEQISRKARIMEKDPIFVDVIIERWEQFSNKKAKKV